MGRITYRKFEMSSYMNSPLFSSECVKLLLALRTRTVEGIRSDFKGQFNDLSCPLKCGEDDTLENVLTCSVIRQHHATVSMTLSDVSYEDIFSNDIRKQKQATELFKQLLEVRQHLINIQQVG